MDWKLLFELRFLERGLQYYHHGMVDSFELNKNQIQASVSGRDIYEVIIEMKNNEVIYMECSCPHAKSGYNCKHMAAVLFYNEAEAGSEYDDVFESLIPTEKNNQKDKEKSINEIINEKDQDVLNQFLLEAILRNDLLYNEFIQKFEPDNIDVDFRKAKEDINYIFSSNSIKGFIDYYHADNFFTQLSITMDEHLSNLLNCLDYVEAFNLTKFIYNKMNNAAIDDSSGSWMIYVEDNNYYWQEILEKCDLKLRRKIYLWFVKQIEDDTSSFLIESIEDLLFSHFLDQEFVEKNIIWAEKMINHLRVTGRGILDNINAGKWAVRYIKILETQKVDESIITEHLNKYLNYHGVRQYFVDKCILNEDYNIAIKTLKDGKLVDKKFRGLVSSYSNQLKDLYALTNDNQNYRKELWELVISYQTGDLELYKELKSFYSEEDWKIQREIVFEKLANDRALKEFYVIEKLYDRLLNSVLESSDLYTLTSYEKYLRKLYPQELLSKYEEIVKKMALQSLGRSHYRKINSVLIKMLKYPQGNQRVSDIVDSFKIQYKNRPAMMEELKWLLY